MKEISSHLFLPVTKLTLEQGYVFTHVCYYVNNVGGGYMRNTPFAHKLTDVIYRDYLNILDWPGITSNQMQMEPMVKLPPYQLKRVQQQH